MLLYTNHILHSIYTLNITKEPSIIKSQKNIVYDIENNCPDVCLKRLIVINNNYQLMKVKK